MRRARMDIRQLTEHKHTKEIQNRSPWLNPDIQPKQEMTTTSRQNTTHAMTNTESPRTVRHVCRLSTGRLTHV